MKRPLLSLVTFSMAFLLLLGAVKGQNVPELLYYKFDGTGTSSVPNLASSPVGANPAPITGGLSQGNVGQFGAALVGNGGTSTSNVINTGWPTSLSGSWTISFWVSNIAPSTTLYYIFGDAGASTFRCFTNGVANPNNWLLRGGGLTDIPVYGAAVIAPHVVTIVYDVTVPEARAYVDGVLNSTTAQPVVSISGTGLQIGGYGSNTNLASGGLMDEFRIYNRALTPTEITKVWNSTLPASSAHNDAGVALIDSPKVFCEGSQNIVATIQNYGKNQVNPVTVNWTYNSILQTPVVYNQLLDTFGGIGPYQAKVVLGTKSFTSGVVSDIVAWTSAPNGVTDTVSDNDSAYSAVMPSMNGTYTIDPFGSGITNFIGFKDAADALNAFGVCGPVTFNIASGLYSEQLTLKNIQGASEINTILFQPNPLNTSPVELSYSGTAADNYVVKLNGASHVTFDGIHILSSGTYSTAVRFEGGAKFNTIKNCQLTAPLAGSTSTNNIVLYANGAENEGNKILNNKISGGSYGIYYRGTSTAVNVKGIEVSGNVVKDPYYMGIYFYYTDGLKVKNNKVSSISTYTSGYGIYSYYGYNDFQVVGNEVLSKGGIWPLYGMNLYYPYGADTARALIANNMIHVGNASSGSAHYGLVSYGATYCDVVYNSVVVQSSSTTSRAGYIYSGSNNRAMNNNFLNYGNGYTVYTLTGNYTWDYNNLATMGATFAYNSSAVANFSAWKSAGNGANSISVNNLYPNPDSLRTCDTAIYKKGTPINVMAFDFDGDPRMKTKPNIGADEFIADAADFSIGDTITFCGGTELEIGSTMNDATFNWSTGALTPTIIVTEEGNYSVSVDGPCVVGMIDDVEVIDVNPVANFTFDKGQFIGGFTNTSEHGTSYLWDFGDGTTSTQENPWHQYAANGVYTVTLTVMNYCDTVSFQQQVGFSVGVNETVLDKNIRVYPNPASDVINLAIGDLDDQTIRIQLIDMRGQVHADQLVKVSKGGVEQLNISSLSKGVYLVKMTSSSEVSTRQIVVR